MHQLPSVLVVSFSLLSPAPRAPWRRTPPAAAAVMAEPERLVDDGGVLKRQLCAAPTGGRTPEFGAVVKILYTCGFENGTLIDAKHRAEPFQFQLNAGIVVDGLERGVESMVEGERAQFTCSPEWAYGAVEAGDLLPAESTLVYEVELLEWRDGPPVEQSAMDLRAYRAHMEGRPVAEGRTEAYGWVESGEELSLTFRLEEGLRSRDIGCDFQPRALRVQAGGAVLASGELRGKVRTDECYWIIEEEGGEGGAGGGRSLKVVLAKAVLYTQWRGVFRHGPLSPPE